METGYVHVELLAREAQRIFRHFGASRLEARPGGDYALTTRPGGRAKLRVGAAAVQAFAQRGLIALESDGRFALTPEGTALAARLKGGADGFAAQHGIFTRTPEGQLINRASSPLDWLRQHRAPGGALFLSVEERDAADQLERDFELSQMRPRLGQDWSMLPVGGKRRASGGGSDVPLMAIDARRRVYAALEAAGPVLGDVLFDICCEARPFSMVERGHGLPQRAGKAVAKIALLRLAVHYGLLRAEASLGRLRVWRPARAGETQSAAS